MRFSHSPFLTSRNQMRLGVFVAQIFSSKLEKLPFKIRGILKPLFLLFQQHLRYVQLDGMRLLEDYRIYLQGFP